MTKKKLSVRRKRASYPKINIRKSRLVWIFGTALIFAIFLISAVRLNRGFFQDISMQLHDRMKSFGRSSGVPEEFGGHRILSNNLGVINGNIVALSDVSFESITFGGKKISSRAHNFSNPGMKSCGTKAIIYNIGGYDYKIESCRETILQGNLDEKIISADVARNGIHALITQSGEYLSQMSVFCRDKVEKYKYSFCDFYICDVALQPNGKGAAVCGMSSSKGQICSVVYVFDLNSLDPIYTCEFEGNMIISVDYLSNGSLVAVGEKSSVIINVGKKDKKEITYSPRTIKCMDINKKRGIAYCLVLSDKNKTSNLLVTGKEGEVRLNIEIGHAFDDIMYDNDKIYGIENKKLFIYDISGELQKEIDTGNTLEKIIKAENSRVFMLSGKSIMEIKI